MWTAIGTTVLKTVAGAVLNKNESKKNSNENGHNGSYNIEGHINHMPVNVSVNSGAGSSGSYRPPTNPSNHFAYEEAFLQRQHSMSYPTQTKSANIRNLTDNSNQLNKQKSSKSKNEKFVMVNKPKTGKINKPSDQASCKVQMPSNGNFKITIEKTETEFGKMNLNCTNKKCNNNDNKQNQEIKNKQFKRQNSNGPTNNSGNRKNTTNIANFKNTARNSHQNVESKTWMYIGKLKLGTTDADLKSYLTIKFPKHNFTVQTLPLYKDGKLPCFKVLVNNSILDEFEDLKNWPMGVTIKKYQHNFKS